MPKGNLLRRQKRSLTSYRISDCNHGARAKDVSYQLLAKNYDYLPNALAHNPAGRMTAITTHMATSS